MSADSRWYLISYDVRDPKRLRRTMKLLKSFGERLQYSVFRVHCTGRQLERLHWELLRIMDEEDFLLIVGLCPSCHGRIIQKGGITAWIEEDEPAFIVA